MKKESSGKGMGLLDWLFVLALVLLFLPYFLCMPTLMQTIIIAAVILISGIKYFKGGNDNEPYDPNRGIYY